MITVQRERWIDCIDQIMPLCHQVFAIEEAKFTGLPLDLDLDTYEALDNTDYLHCLVMRNNGHAVGFHWIMIDTMLRHKGRHHAHTDAIYVHPEHRRHSHVLIDYSEKYISQRADFWTLANLAASDRAIVWQRKGFIPIETIMFKKV